MAYLISFPCWCLVSENLKRSLVGSSLQCLGAIDGNDLLAKQSGRNPVLLVNNELDLDFFLLLLFFSSLLVIHYSCQLMLYCVREIQTKVWRTTPPSPPPSPLRLIWNPKTCLFQALKWWKWKIETGKTGAGVRGRGRGGGGGWKGDCGRGRGGGGGGGVSPGSLLVAALFFFLPPSGSLEQATPTAIASHSNPIFFPYHWIYDWQDNVNRQTTQRDFANKRLFIRTQRSAPVSWSQPPTNSTY